VGVFCKKIETSVKLKQWSYLTMLLSTLYYKIWKLIRSEAEVIKLDFSKVLNQIHGAISYQSSELNDQIDRLERAKMQIEREQSESMNEMRKILDPELDHLWKGTRADAFHEDRNEAYRIMRNIAEEDYDGYTQRIQISIHALAGKRTILNAASGLAHEADKLLALGEDAFEELGSKLDDLKRRLF
jgi:hypothetical protein